MVDRIAGNAQTDLMSRIIQAIISGARTPSMSDYADQFALDETRESFQRRLAFDYINFRRHHTLLNIVIITVSILILMDRMPTQWILLCFGLLGCIELTVMWMVGTAKRQIEEKRFDVHFWNRFKYGFNIFHFLIPSITLALTLTRVPEDLRTVMNMLWLTIIIYSSALNYFDFRFNIITASLQAALNIFVNSFAIARESGLGALAGFEIAYSMPAISTALTSIAVMWFFRLNYINNLLTERKNNLANARLRQSHTMLAVEKRFSDQVTEAISDAIVVTDDEFLISRNNRALNEIFDIPPGQEPSHLNKIIGTKSLLRHDGKKRSFERPRGQHLIIEGKRFIDADGSGRIVYIIADVSEKVRADEITVQAQKINALGNLTGGIAHDFNNYLAVIMSNAELIRYSEDLDEIKKKFVADIIAASNSATGLTKRILTSVRKMPTRSDEIEPANVMENIKQLLRNSLEPYHNLRVEMNCSRVFHADRVLLENAMLNLILNARDAMPKGGEILIRVFEEDEYIVFSVEDKGCGIDEDMIDKVIEPFFTLKPLDKGSGIGLSMVNEFAKRSSGSFKLSSKKNKGTTAQLRLPLQSVAKQKPSKQIISKPKLRKGEASRLKILVVDDNDPLTRSLAAHVKRLGHEADVAQSLQDVRGLPNVKSYDVVLCDVVLHKESGVEIWEHFQKKEADAKFIFISGNVPPKIARKLRAIGANEVLHKPLNTDELVEKISQV